MSVSQKEEIGKKIVEEFPETGVVAFGSGSTVNAIIHVLGKLREEGAYRDLKFVSGSSLTSEHLSSAGLPELSFHSGLDVSLCVDGADQVTMGENNYVLKGRGGALLREKVLWRYSPKVIVGITSDKLVKGITGDIPIEITPYSLPHVERMLNFLYQDFRWTLRRHGTGIPFYTDGGNWIVDLSPPSAIGDPHGVCYRIKAITGVVDTGLFTDFENVEAYVHDGASVRTMSLSM